MPGRALPGTLVQPQRGGEGGGGRVLERDLHRRPGADVTVLAGALQRKAIHAWWQGEDSTLEELFNIQQPTLIFNGIRDIMVPTPNSLLMAQKIPDAELIVYPDSGHGALFQYPNRFSRDVLGFIASRERGGGLN